jgi:hypothetical protein
LGVDNVVYREELTACYFNFYYVLKIDLNNTPYNTIITPTQMSDLENSILAYTQWRKKHTKRWDLFQNDLFDTIKAENIDTTPFNDVFLIFTNTEASKLNEDDIINVVRAKQDLLTDEAKKIIGEYFIMVKKKKSGREKETPKALLYTKMFFNQLCRKWEDDAEKRDKDLGLFNKLFMDKYNGGADYYAFSNYLKKHKFDPLYLNKMISNFRGMIDGPRKGNVVVIV